MWPWSGPVLLPVAARLAQAGVRVVAVLEATPAPAAPPQAAGLAAFPGQLPQASGYAAVLARHGVPVRTGYAVVACQGTDRVERAVIARLEGYLAGTSAARYLAGLPPDAYAERTRPLRARLEHARRLTAQLGEAYPLQPGWLGWPDAGTVICRCVETRWSEIGAAVEGGARDLRAVEEMTRAWPGRLPGTRLRAGAAVRGIRRLGPASRWRSGRTS